MIFFLNSFLIVSRSLALTFGVHTSHVPIGLRQLVKLADVCLHERMMFRKEEISRVKEEPAKRFERERIDDCSRRGREHGRSLCMERTSWHSLLEEIKFQVLTGFWKKYNFILFLSNLYSDLVKIKIILSFLKEYK